MEGSDPRGTGARFGRGAEFACAPPSPPPSGVATLEIIPAGRRKASRSGRIRVWSAMPDSPPASRSANGSHPPSRSGARRSSGMDWWLGVTRQRRGGVECPSPSSPMPIEACPRWGSLPATASMAGSASPLRRPWHNRKRDSGIRNRRHVHRRRDFVSGDPRSTMYTRGSASARASVAQNESPRSRADRHAVKPSIAAPEEGGKECDEPSGVVPEALNPEWDGYERAAGKIGVGAWECAVRCRHPTYEARFLWCSPTNPTMTRSPGSSQAKAIRIVWCGS